MASFIRQLNMCKIFFSIFQKLTRIKLKFAFNRRLPKSEQYRSRQLEERERRHGISPSVLHQRKGTILGVYQAKGKISK
jgi:hypothetical protein